MLAMACFRMIAKRAIEGRTWAGNLVEDSPGRIEDLRDNGAKEGSPFVALYCDEAGTDAVEGTRDSVGLFDPLSTTLVLECGSVGSFEFTPAASANNPAPRAESVTSINATDSGTELMINMLARQAVDALMDTRHEAIFSELWRMLGDVKSVRIVRGGPKEDERAPRVRYASQIVVIRADLIAEPPRGADLRDYPFWTKLLAVFAADEEFAPIGNLIQAHLQQGVDGQTIPDYQLAAKLLNLPLDAIEGLGIAPVKNQEDPAQKFASVSAVAGKPSEFPFPQGYRTNDG